MPSTTREYLTRILARLHRGLRYALEEDYMPLDSMQFLLSRHPTQVSLWSPDFEDHSVVWLSSKNQHHSVHTMDSLLQIQGGAHNITFSEAHFYQIFISQAVTSAFMNAMLKHLSEATTPNILATDVEEGAVVVYQPGSHWAIGIDGQHKRCLRRGLL